MHIRVQRDTHERKDGTAMVRLYLYRTKVLRHPLDIWVKKSQWDKGRREVRFGTHDNAAGHNRTIANAVAAAQRACSDNPHWTEAQVRDHIARPKVVQESRFIAWARKNTAEDPERTWNTRKVRYNALARLEELADPEIKEVDAVLLQKVFHSVMAKPIHRNSSVKKRRNYATGIVRTLSTMYNKAAKAHGIRPVDVLEGINMGDMKATVEIITPQEFIRLMEYRTTRENRQLAIDLWIIAAMAGGIRFGDLITLKRSEIRDGRWNLDANKTDRNKNLPILPEAARRLAKYHGDPYVFLPHFSGNVEPSLEYVANRCAAVNSALKKVAQECGIEKNLRTHTHRHAFVAWARYKGIQDSMIQDIVGIGDKAWKHYVSDFPEPQRDAALLSVFDQPAEAVATAP